jgi:F-type H+-transporting ATPase subunit delta
MIESTVAKRYAAALFELALSKQSLQEVGQDLKAINTAISSNEELVSVLNAPKIPTARKKEIVAQIFASANADVLNTVLLLLDKKRVTEIAGVEAAFQKLAADAQGYADATVYSTRELTDAEKEEVSSAFGKLVGKSKLNITNVIDASLIGGVRVQIGNYTYDSTIAAKLEGLKKVLVG